MHPDASLVSHLQSLDQQAAVLEKEVAALPKHIATIEKTLESHLKHLEANRAALAANQRDRRKYEGDIEMGNQKMSKLRDQMAGAKNNEQYKAFQHEIDFLQAETRKAEDKILELMTASEAFDSNVKKAEVALKQEKVTVDAEKKLAQDRTAESQAKLKDLKDQRKEAASKLKPGTLAQYERLRKKWNGVVMVEVKNGRCSICQIMLRPQYFQELRLGTDLLPCESCGRFLIYNPAVLTQEDGTRVAMS